MVKEVTIAGGRVGVTIELTTPACPSREVITRTVTDAVAAVAGVTGVDVKLTAKVWGRPNHPSNPRLPGVKNIIAVAAGKGGVGKSTVSTNLAAALSRLGAKVGILDADVYGPSVPQMMGAPEKPAGIETGNKIVPALHHGMHVISVGFFVERGGAVIWRGPMVHKLLQQFIEDVEWGELDYLVVDLPPGTGDAQLSLVQATQVSGAIIVTTPQEVAVGDALRGAKMFERVGVPVIGVVENMSYFESPETGKPIALFGTGGGKRLADELGVALLGEVPLYPPVLEGGDTGRPIVASDPKSTAARKLVEIAGKLAAF
jgi:ATP-binding protein involved in chromosome partitioning